MSAQKRISNKSVETGVMHRGLIQLHLAFAALMFAVPAFAAPIAVDDEVAVPSNTTVFANDLSANDTSVATDTYSITVAPANGTATLTADGLLDYTPNIGFASLDSLTYSIDDGAGGIDTATVTLNVVLTSDFLTPANDFIIGQEDVPTPLNLSVDPSLNFGGTLQDLIGVDALYRDETGAGTPVASTIPTGTTGINIIGYATRNVDTSVADDQNDDYTLFTVNVDLREGTYSGRLTYSVNPNQGNNTIDQYTWINVPLGQSVLSDTSYVSGYWTGDADALVEIVSGEIRITETIPLQIAYHVEYMTADGDSTDFISASGDVQPPNDSQSTFSIPADLEPADGSKHGYLVLTGNSAANGSNFAHEHKGFSRLVVDLESNTVSGVVASERGELDTLVTTWAFVDYPLIDLRDTPAATPVAITASTATIVGDTTATVGVGVEDDPTVYIDASGDLIVDRDADHAAAFTTMFTNEYYKRTGLSSIASFVGVESDTTLFDSNPIDGVDPDGKAVNLQTFDIPASSSIGIIQMSWQTIGGSSHNENVGYGFAVIDLNTETSSGSITFSRTTTPDLVAWQDVPINTTMFGATAGGVDLYQSNKTSGTFTDGYPETARFTLVDNGDGTRTLEFSATSTAGGNNAYADYLGTAQVSWLGSEPFRVEGVPIEGILSHGSPVGGGGWEVDFEDIPLLTISTDEHGTGELRLDLVLSSTGELDTVIVHVEPVVDPPVLTVPDVVGYVNNPVTLGISVGDSLDIDGSETQLQTLSLSGVPSTVTLSASAGTVTNFGGGNWEVDTAALASLQASGTNNVTATVTVSGTNIDTDDLDGDGVIEDSNNGAGVDELDIVTYQDTFELVLHDIPTVTSQVTNTGTPIISGTANVGTGETLSVLVNGITYTAGDGNLTDNGDGTWDLAIPGSDTIADGTYAITANLSHVNGGSGDDITLDELIIDTSAPVAPTVTSQTTSDATPAITGTATVGIGETLTVTVDGVTYTAGDGNLTDNADGTWTLAITTPLAEGTYDVTAAVTDTAGNTTVDASASELIVQATPLSTPTVVALTTTDTTPSLTGNAVVGTGDTLTVLVDGVTYTAGDGNLTYNSDGSWVLDIPAIMVDGTYEVVATVTDVFGNAYPDTSSDELVIDTTAPTIPTVTSQTTNNTTPIISGTATVGLGETLSVTVDGVTYTAGDGNLIDNGDGTWDLTVPTPLTEATYSVTATVTDAAGNLAIDTTASELIIDTTVPAIPTVVSQTTSNTTPTISGTAVVGSDEALSVSVAGSTYTAGDGNLVLNGDGTWDLFIPAPLADGNYSVTATVSDAAGNTSDDATALELTIDTIAPVTPTVASLSTNATSPVITGTATVSAGDTLSVSVNGTTYTAGDGYLVDNGDGTWALSIPVTLDEGTYDVTTTVTDAAGNATDDTTSGELIIDLTAPIAPGVTSLGTTDTTPVINGTATVSSGETLTVEVNGIIYTAGDGDLVINGDGTWALTIPATNLLAEGLYQVIARVTDAAGNSALDPGIDDLRVDLTAPLAPGVDSLTTNDTTPTIEGSAVVAPDETLTVEVNGITYTTGDGNLVDNGDGTWSLTIPTNTPEGSYDVTATVTDSVGNLNTDPSASELLIDTTAPVTPTTTPLVTSNTTPTLVGTANAGPGETLTVTVDGVTYTAGDGNLTDNGDGTWALAIPTPLADGSYEVIASVTDAAGNVSTDTNSNELLIDTLTPTAPTVNSLVTNNNLPVLSGTTSTAPGETLSVTVDGVTYIEGDGNLVVNADGTWNLSIPTANAMLDGTYDVIATVTDLAGNTTNDATVSELVIDTASPTIPTVVSQITSNTTPVISGTANVGVGETLNVTVDGVTYTAGDGNLVDNGDGTWDLTVPTPLTDSTYPVTVTVADVAGNSSDDVTTAELTIDTTPPVTPTVVSQSTNNNTPTISGTATVAAGETLSVTVDGATYIAGNGDLVDNGDGTWELIIPAPMADAVYEVIATVTDTAGNSTSDTSASELIIDTITPVVPTVTAQLTNDTTPVIEGTATVGAGETLNLNVGGITYTAGDGFLVDNGDGTWSLSIATAMPEGSYEVIATVTDTAGNISTDTSSTELIIDTTPPVLPTVVSQITNNNTPTISGTATVTPGDTLTVSVDGTTYTAGDGFLVDNGDGTWALAIPLPLAEGPYDVTTTVTDAAGNASTDSTAGELVIDLTAPIAPGVTSLATANDTPVIEGTATIGAGETLTVEINGVVYTAGDGNLVDNGDGTWALTIPGTDALLENLYQVVATVTDEAGNSASDPGVDDLLVDFTAPVSPGVTSLTTNNTTPTLNGTAIIAAGETLTVEVNGIIYTAGDGNLVDNGDGTWTLSIPVALAEAVYDVTATITDIAGNTSTDPSSSELLIDITAPTTPTATPLITSNTSPVISGTANAGPGETLTVTVDAVTYTAGDGNLVDNGDGTWDLTIPVALAEGIYDVTATVTDAAGNTSTDTGNGELQIDITDPVSPTVNNLVTNDSTPVLSGTTSSVAGETLSVSVDGVTYTAGDGNLVDNGDGTWDLTIPAANLIADGSYEVIATITDLAGNTSSDASATELTVDTTPPVIPTVVAQTTNNNTPTISGTATVGIGETLSVTVDGVTYTDGDGSLVDNGDGTWDLAVPTALSDNLYPVTVTVTDTAGNSVDDTTTTELVIDTSAPVTPTVTPLYTSNTTPTISGTATIAAGETLTVTVNGNIYTAGDGNLINNGDGTWVLNILAVTPEGVYDVVASVTDAAGNASTETTVGELTIDTTAPVVPSVVSQNTNDNTPLITGTATVASGETLSVTLAGVTYTAGDGNLIDNGDGTWNLTVPVALSDNTYPITVSVVDAAGNTSADTTTNELVIDTTAPVVPTVLSQITNVTTPLIEGTASVAAGETLTVTVDGITYTAGDGNLVDNGDGTWSLTIPAPLAEGIYDVVATVTDTAGNSSSDTSAGELTIDTTSPVVPGVTAQNTSSTTPTISGTATVAPGETLTVTVNGVTYTAGDGNLVDNGDGTWDLNIPTPLTDNTYPVTVTVIDAAGNSSTDVTSAELVIDTTDPVTPTVLSQITNNNTPVIEGTATIAAGETLTVTVDGSTYTAGDGDLVDNGDGTWALTIPAALADGPYDVAAAVTDTAGNVSSDVTLSELIIDTVAPVVPTVQPQTTNNTSPTITGTATVAPGETLTVTVDGTTYTAGDGNLTDNGDGTWTLSLPLPLSEGSFDITATVTDPAGNIISDTSAGELTIDITAPVAPGVTSQITANATPTIEGTATIGAGETLSVEVDGVVYTAGDGNLIDNGDGTWALTIPAANSLLENTYQVIATVTDAAGNSATDPGVNDLLVDFTAPAAPGVTSQTTNNTTPTITGTATVALDEILTVEVNGVVYTAGDGNLSDNGDGTWTLFIPTPLTEGLYDVTATVTDAAGNISTDPSSGELLIDTTAPTTPTTAPLTTSNTSPMISGTANAGPGETLTVTVDGVTYTAGDGNLVDNGDGTWTLSIPTSLPEGTYDVVATVTDAAGNVSTDTNAGELVIDTTTPVIPTVTAQTSGTATPTVSGTATLAPGETLTVEVNGVVYTVGDGNLIDNGDGTWNLSIPTPLSDNTYSVTVNVIDAAGNSTTDITSAELVIDTTVPATPTVVSQVTNDTTPVVEGTASVAPGETLTVSVNGTTYIAGDGNLVDNGDGTWTLSILTALPEGAYDIVATVTDIAGNVSTDTNAGELVIDTTSPVAPGVTSQVSASGTPVIEGTVSLAAGETLSVEVNGEVYTAGDGNLVVNADGTWTLTIPQSNSLTEGSYEVTATVTDAAGNSSVDAGIDELLIDFTAPAAPGVTSLTTNNTTPVIEGTATLAPGETLTVEVNGVVYTAGDGNLVDNGDGTWTLTIPTPLPEGSYDVVATVTDSAGNTTTDPSASELLIDTTNPTAPTATPQTSTDSSPVVSGTANVGPDEILSVTINGVTYTAGDGNLVDNGDGTWALTLPLSLPDGTYDVTTTITDEAGNSTSDSGNGELVIDSTPPDAPTAESLTTTNTTPAITGTADVSPGDTLSVTVDGITYTAGDGSLTDNGDGTWTLNIPFDLPVGNYTVQVALTDAAGNTSTGEPAQLTIEAAEIIVAQADFDGDGVPDALDLDDDNDGIPDTSEGLSDTDGDGQPDYQDLDSDNDGISDIIEVMGDDIDNNYTVDNFVDENNNGLSDELEAVPFVLVDTDHDLIADFRDLDSDNDGLTDALESGGADADHDGHIDAFADNDNNGADDASQNNGPAGRDSDGDGVPNRLDLDTDNDALFDLVEAGTLDANNDGILDSMLDTDLDGIPDSVDVDTSNGNDTNGNGIDDQFDFSVVGGADTDSDGIADQFDPDADGDGFADDVSNSPSLGQGLPDSNGNGVADVLEPNPGAATDISQSGKVRTGLAGSGCSVGNHHTTKMDPTLMLLILISFFYLLRSIRISIVDPNRR